MRLTILLAALLLVCGCSDPKKASEANFKKAIQNYLDENPPAFV